MKPIMYLLTAGFLLIASQVFGQTLVTTLTPATVTASVGSGVNLQLKVTGFTNVNSIQFPITYNNALLKFDSIYNSALPGFTNGNYFVPTAGKVNVSWFADPGAYPTGFTVASNTSIFTLHFTVLADGMSTVNLANTAPGIEVIADGAPITVNYQSGGSTVTGGSGQAPLMGFHIIANTINIPQGQTACMPVTVHDFDNIVSMQYAMHWNSTILEYQNTQSYNLPDLTAASFGGTPASGTQLLGWSDPSAQGVTRADGTQIYAVCFKAIGAPGSSSLVTIDGMGFPPGTGNAEAFNAASQNVWVVGTTGITDTIFVTATPPPSNAVTFTADKDTVGVGGQACVDVKVKNFNSIIAMQYGMTYDATKLQFQTIQLTPNPLTLSLGGNFNTGTAGQIKFSWSDPAAVGVTLPDNTKIFSVCFTAAAPLGSPPTPVNFTSLPGLPIEIVKEPDGPVTPNMVNGHVFVSNVVPTVSINAVAACGGGNTGSATANVQNATAMSYAWSGPGGPISNSNLQTITGLAPGDYTVTVTLTAGGTITNTGTVGTSPAILIPTPQLTISNVKCNGDNNGAISLTVTGGTPGYTYAWSGPGGFSAATDDITNLGPGIYTLQVTDQAGCSFTSQPYTISQPAVLNTSLTTTQNVACFGSASGQAVIAVSGGTPTYGYNWYTVPGGSLASTAKNPTNFSPGTYNVTVTDANMCTTTLPNPVTITGPSSALAVATPVDKGNVECYGANTGFIHLNINGGWSGNYTVNWDPATPGGANLNGIPGGTYNATVTDQGGCTLVLQPITVNQPPAIVPGTPVVQHVSCAGQGDGSIGIQVSGGNGAPYTVNWDGTSLSGQTISNLDGGDYIPVVTDGIGCTFALPAITVNESAPIQPTNEVVTIQTPGMSDGAVSLDLVGGTGNYTILWTGPNAYTSSSEDIANLAPGDYVLLVTDSDGCSFTKTYEVRPPFSVSTASVSPSCGNDGCIVLEVAGGSPPFQVNWTGSASGSSLSNNNTISICTFAKGIYNITIADNASNVFTLPSPVNVPGLQPALVSPSVSNPNQTFGNGSIVLNPVPDTVVMNYIWTGPNNFTSTSNAIMNRDSGQYTVTVTNTNSGCTAVYTWHLVRQWPALVVGAGEVQDPSCANTSNGSIGLNVSGGNPPYEYAWTGPNGFTGNTQVVTGLPQGAYNVTVTDQNDTLGVFNVNLTAESQLAVSGVNISSNYGGFQVSGADVCNGIGTVIYNGGVGTPTFQWSNGGTTAINNALCAGNYTVVVTDGLGCTAAFSGDLSSPPAIVPALQIVNSISCYDECDGVARVTVNGGVAPYTVKWSTNQIDQVPASGAFSQAVNLCGGDYTVTVTDNLGATKVYQVPVPEPAPLAIEFSQLVPQSFNSCDGEIIATVPGASGAITYTWSGSLGHSGDGQRAEGLCAGEIVQFIVQDALGCIGTGIDTLDYPVDGCYQVRPVITPGQQDGNNDFVYITCIENVPNSIEIYNRWGQLVYQATGYDNGATIWEGTNKAGQPLAEGVYFYVLNYTDPVRGEQQQKGHINLLR